MNYKSNYGVSQLTWEYINNIVLEENSYSAGALGPVIESNGKYYVTTLNPNVDILDIPETLSKNPTDTNYYGNYYKTSVVLDKSLPVDDARTVIGNTKNSWIKAYESNYQTPYQLDSSPEELQEYFKEFESNTGKQIEVFEIKDGNHTISYRDNEGNLVNLEVDIKKNVSKPKQLNKIKTQYQDVYKDRDLQITENPDGTYNLVVDGKVVKTFKLDDYDLSSEKELFNLNEIKTSDKLNNDNKIVIEEYYQELFNDKNVVVKENEDGTYSLIADDKEIIFDKDSTLAEAVTKANSELNNGKPVQAVEAGESTRGLSELTNSEYSIYINTGDFERIVESHNMAKNIISDCSSGYNTGMFTEKLLAAYNELVGSEGNQDPVKRINKASELLNEVTTNIHYSLEAYKNIDHNLGIVINSIIEEIFTVNSYTNRHSVDGALSIEEKEEKIKKSIKFVEDTIRDLEAQYNKDFTNNYGVSFSNTITRLLVGLADGLGLESGNTEANIDYYPDSDRYMNENIVRLDMNKLTNTINFIKEHDVVTKLSLYTKADALDSWTTSGMSELNEFILKNSNVSDYSQNQKNEYAERMFLLRYIRNQGEDKIDLENKYNGYSPEYYLTDNLTGNSELDTKFLLTRKEIKKSIKELISKQMNEKMMITNYENKDVYYNAFELCDYYNSDEFKNAEQELMDNILTLRNAKYNYEQYLEIMPFLEGKNEKEYLDYLVKDYSKYDLSYSDIANRIKYLDQEEIALYFMFQGQGKNDEAEKYLESMSDLIAQREGFELAATRIYGMNQNGDDIWDLISSGANGFTDGLEGFFRNVSNCFFSDGKRDAIDYRNMYMVSLLDTKNIYSDKLSDTYRNILKRNYNVMSGVGSMLIPALSRFIPYVGWAVSPAMLGMTTFGGSVESAKQLGKSDVQSYLYGAFNTCSTMLLYKLLSGIPGVGNGQVPSSLMQFTSGINQAATRAVLSTYIDATLRSTILQEPADFSHLSDQAFDSAINAMFISAIMQTGTKLSFKLADNLTVNLSKGEYSSYQDFLQDTEAQFKATPTGQRLLMLYRMNPEEYKNYRGHVSHGLLDRLVENVSKNDKSDIPWDLTSESENIIGMKMPMGSRFVFDPNSSNYYIINMSDGSGMTVPSTFISNHEPGPIQYTAPYAGLYSGIRNINESSYTSNDVLPSIYKGSSDNSGEVVTLETPTETSKEGTDVVVVATNDETNDVNIVQIQNVEQLVGDRIANTKNDVGPMMVFGTPKEGALMTNPEFVYRLTGLDQVDDIIETGFVRARDGGARQARIIKSGGMPRIWWSKGSENGFINPDDRAVLVGPAETITDGKVGAASLGELTGIYLFNENTGEYENHLEEIKEKHAELANPPTEDTLPENDDELWDIGLDIPEVDDWGFDDEPKTPAVLRTPDEILEAYKKEGMDKYSMYDMKSAMNPDEKYVYLRSAEKQLKNYLGLARTPEEQEVLSEILLNGGYKGVGFDSQLCTHDNRTTEEARRLSMATLYMTNPETFKTIMEDGITMFHGTSSEILDKIMNQGLLSPEKIQELGEEVKTGEFGRFTQGGIDMNNSIRGKNFISFTDVFDLAHAYAKDTEDGGFGIVVGTTPEDIKSSRRVNIGSDYTEIGVRDSLPTDKIKTLMVPKDKVESVRKVVGNRNIKVLPLDDYEKKSFSFFDELYTSDEKFEELSEFIKNKPIETPDTKEETQPNESKYVITTPNGEKYSADAIGVRRDASGTNYDGVISSYDGEFTDEDIVKLETRTNAPRSVTIGDVSEAKELLNSIKLLAEEESFEGKCAIVGETVNEYFGDNELFFNRSYYLPTDEEVSQGKPQGKVSDIAHKQAAGSIERAMISQNLLKELGIDSTFKLTEYRSPKGAITTHGFNIVKDNGKYYIFDSSDPVLSYGVMSPIVCELPEEVALKMLDPLSKEGTSVSVTYHDSYEDKDSTYTYDAGWKDVYETLANGDQVTKMKNEEYRTNLINGITQSLDSDNPAEKEAADRIFRSYALSNPSEATSYFRTDFNKLLPSTKEELLDKAISTSGYYMLINGIDLSPNGVFYQEDKDAALRIYGKLLEKYKTGEFNYRNMEKVAPYVFKELDPLFPVKADIEDASTRVARDQNYRYLLDYGKEIIDYTIENNIPIDRYVVYDLIGNEVRNNDSDALSRILDAGNYDASGYEAIKHLIKDNGEYIKKVALKHPEFLEGETIKLYEDIDGFVEATKDIPGIKLYYEIDRYSEDIERLHDLYGDKVVYKPTNNSYMGEESYTYDEYKKKDAIIETYANSLRDTKDINGNVKHLTPYEKYIASHIITTKFALYNLPDYSDVDLTRSIYEFIDKTEDRPICCVGYVSMDSEILERQEYPDGLLNMIHWGVNSKAERGAELDSDNHDRSLTYLVDPEYEIDGIYMSDPTWDRIHDNDLSREDVRNRNYNYLLETQEQLSYETWQFKDPLPNMHIETDEDMISIAKQLGITDPDSVKTVRDKFNRPIGNKEYIIALCAINRFVDKNAVMPEVRAVGPNGFTVEEYNRAALSAKMPQEMIIQDEDYHKSIKELADYYLAEYSVDGYEFNSVLDRMLRNRKENDPDVHINYDDVDDVGNINIRYHKLSDEDMAIIDNLPDDKWDYVAKKMHVKVSTYTSEIIETFDSNTPIEDVINKDVDYDALVTLKQTQNHEKLMEILKSLEDPQEEPMSEEDIAMKAIETLNKIIGEKGIIIEDLDKLEGEFNPEEEGLAREYAEKIHSESLEHKETILPLVKKYEDSSLSGKSLEELFKERDEGTLSNFRVLIGLDNQTKDVDSLVRKILIDYSHVNKGVTVDDVANNIHDGLRYTYLIDDTNYTKGTDEIVNSLRERGYIVQTKNLWGNKAYQGVNAVVTDRETGYSFEIQFHTLDSYNTKEILTHDYYAIFRSDNTTKEEKDLANTVQMYYQSKVNVPDGIIGHNFD